MNKEDLIDLLWVLSNNLDKGLSILPKSDEHFAIERALGKSKKIKEINEHFKKDLMVKSEELRNIFPKIKIPTSDKAARSSVREIAAGLEWYFKQHPDHTWENICKATAFYVEEFSKKNYEYMRTLAYFIRKQNKDKSWISDLENYYAQLEDKNEDEIVKPLNSAFKIV